MRHTVAHSSTPAFTWIDVVAPDRDELVAIAAEFGFHAMSVEDCLDPWHLPKHERIGETTFVILRVFDRDARPDASNVQELTRKIAIFYKPGLVITIHRADLEEVRKLRVEFETAGAPDGCTETTVIGGLMNRVLDAFETPLDRADDEVDAYEEALLSRARQSPDLEAIHRLKRRVNILKRVLWQTIGVVQRMVPPQERQGAVFHDVKENAESYYYYADQLVEELNNLLGIHVALSSHRTNEVMRVLTVFSAFFLPLTFIVGIYGMNFDWMPELRHRLGYPAVLGLMALVCVVIAVWFRRRGWLGLGGARSTETVGEP